MKQRLTLVPVALLFLLSVLTSCEKGPGGSRVIRFRAFSAETAHTRTSYSGEVVDGWERINWAENDQIRLCSDKAATEGGQLWADYSIEAASISADGRISSSRLSGAGLLWGSGQGNYHFSGVYPPHAITAGSVSGLTISDAQPVIAANKTETATLVSFAPDMANAWMLADITDVPEGNSDLSIEFYPAFTAFEFTVASQFDATIKVKSFTLSSADTDIAGSFGATLAAGGNSRYRDFSGSRSINVDFGTDGVDITQTKSLRFTVLALPRDIPNLSITFVVEVNGAVVTKTLALKTVNPDAFITFEACRKFRIYGLVLPSGGLQLSFSVADWEKDTADYDYMSDVITSVKCLAGETYRRYDSDSDQTDWDGSHIAVSFGYMNTSDEIIVTDDPAGYQAGQNTLLRPAYSPILELCTTSDPGNVLKLQLDNPRFKFVQYGNNGGSIDLSVRDHTRTDHLDIVPGTGVRTYFSVVPVNQFPIDAAASEKVCRVSLLSVSPGTLHEIPFNLTDDASPVQSLPGENGNELKFMYFGPAEYGTTGASVSNP